MKEQSVLSSYTKLEHVDSRRMERVEMAAKEVLKAFAGHLEDLRQSTRISGIDLQMRFR